MSDEGADYIGSAGTFIDEFELWDYDEYVRVFGEVSPEGIEDYGDYDHEREE